MKKNKASLNFNTNDAMRHGYAHSSFKPLKPKKYKKIKAKLKKARFKPAKLPSADGRSAQAEQFGIEIKLGDSVVFSRVVPEEGSPYGAGTLDIQTNMRIKEILQSALGHVNTSLGIERYAFKY